MLYTETVEPHTFSLLNELIEIPELEDFSLVGGTTLSLFYGHRKSVDLDLFSNKQFQKAAIIDGLKKKFQKNYYAEAKRKTFGI